VENQHFHLHMEILEVIEKYGYPQEWNKNGEYGPERYIEVHVWSDETLKRWYNVSDINDT